MLEAELVLDTIGKHVDTGDAYTLVELTGHMHAWQFNAGVECAANKQKTWDLFTRRDRGYQQPPTDVPPVSFVRRFDCFLVGTFFVRDEMLGQVLLAMFPRIETLDFFLHYENSVSASVVVCPASCRLWFSWERKKRKEKVFGARRISARERGGAHD